MAIRVSAGQNAPGVNTRSSRGTSDPPFAKARATSFPSKATQNAKCALPYPRHKPKNEIRFIYSPMRDSDYCTSIKARTGSAARAPGKPTPKQGRKTHDLDRLHSETREAAHLGNVISLLGGFVAVGHRVGPYRYRRRGIQHLGSQPNQPLRIRRPSPVRIRIHSVLHYRYAGASLAVPDIGSLQRQKSLT